LSLSLSLLSSLLCCVGYDRIRQPRRAMTIGRAVEQDGKQVERVCVCACIVDIEHTVACVVMVQVGLSFGWFGVYKSHTHTKDWTHARMDRHKISRANIFLLGYQRLKRIVCLAISSLLYAQARLKAAAQKTQIQTGLVYTLALTPGRYTYRETEKKSRGISDPTVGNHDI
jgi:hypothetical protein